MSMRPPLFALVLSVLVCTSGNTASDDSLYGAWSPKIYVVEGKEYAMSGLMLITPGYFSANTIFKLSDASPADANANAGPYQIKNGKIVLNQWMQLHWRPANHDENFLAVDVPEEIPFEVEGDRLTFFFPSGNKYISERLADIH